MALRWTAAGMLEAEGQFRRTIGYQQLAKLAVAIDREPVAFAPTEEVAPRQCVVKPHPNGPSDRCSSNSGIRFDKRRFTFIVWSEGGPRRCWRPTSEAAGPHRRPPWPWRLPGFR